MVSWLGFEPLTSRSRGRRSTTWAIRPDNNVVLTRRRSYGDGVCGRVHYGFDAWGHILSRNRKTRASKLEFCSRSIIPYHAFYPGAILHVSRASVPIERNQQQSLKWVTYTSLWAIWGINMSWGGGNVLCMAPSAWPQKIPAGIVLTWCALWWINLTLTLTLTFISVIQYCLCKSKKVNSN
jgi:hypothetical protein